MFSDLRYALRSLAGSRGFFLTTVLMLALGIGANTAIFSVVNGVILDPLPFESPSELVKIGVTRAARGSSMSSMSQPDLRDVQSEIPSVRSSAGYSGADLTLTEMGDAEAVRGAYVTDGLLEVFGESPILGRDIRTEENVPDGPRVVLVGYSFWQERLDGNAEVLGDTLQLDGEPYEIVGVAPPGFDYPREAQLWVPAFMNLEDCGRGCHFLRVIGRLAEGSSIALAREQLRTLSLRLQAEYPEDNYDKIIDLVTLEEDIVGDVRTALYVLLGSVGMVLLIACANVANLLLARASARAGEMATRSALGAARGRLVRQLMIEALVLATIGGAAGVALAHGGIATLLRLAPTNIPRLENVHVDGTVMVFAIGAVALITILFGLVPALRLARTPVAKVLHQSGRGAPGGANQDWSRAALLVAEVAFSLMLLFGAGLLLRSFSNLNAVQLGFEKDRILSFRIELPDVPYHGDGDATVQFFERLEERLSSLPGVDQVGSAFGTPFGGNVASVTSLFLDRPKPPVGQEEVLLTRIVTPGYHETLGIPLLRGRKLQPTDRNGVERVAVVSQALADRYYPDSDPIGQQIQVDFGWSFDSVDPWRIVGVVGDVRSRRVTREPRPEIYLPQAQMGATSVSVMLRLTSDGASVLPAIREEVRAIDPNVPLRRVEMMNETVDRQYGPARFYLLLLGIFAGVAVTLAGIGLYGVVAYLVSRRTREIGIRRALGASGGDIVRMVLLDGIKPAAYGVAIGIAGAFWGSRVLKSLLYNVHPNDLATFAGVTALLVCVVVFAIVQPARRASRAPMVDALRTE